MANCSKCDKKVGYFDLSQGLCSSCLADQITAREKLLSRISTQPDTVAEEQREQDAAITAIILTTESAHDLNIAERLEIISAECVLGMNIFQDSGSAVRDLVGGRKQTFQTKLREARKLVLNELKREAHQLGADAVVAVDLDYSEISGGGKSMLFVVATGTAVGLNPTPKLI